MESKAERKHEKKIQRHTVVIKHDFDTNNSWSETIFCPFPAEEVKVKQLGFRGDEALVGLYYVRCDSLTGVVGGSMGAFINPIISFTGITYPITSQTINGSHTLTIYDGNAPTEADFSGASIIIHLEFRRWV